MKEHLRHNENTPTHNFFLLPSKWKFFNEITAKSFEQQQQQAFESDNIRNLTIDPRNLVVAEEDIDAILSDASLFRKLALTDDALNSFHSDNSSFVGVQFNSTQDFTSLFTDQDKLHTLTGTQLSDADIESAFDNLDESKFLKRFPNSDNETTKIEVKREHWLDEEAQLLWTLSNSAVCDQLLTEDSGDLLSRCELIMPRSVVAIAPLNYNVSRIAARLRLPTLFFAAHNDTRQGTW
jgi:hypothetical protein